MNALGQIRQTSKKKLAKSGTFSLQMVELSCCCGPRFLGFVSDPQKQWGKEKFKIIIPEEMSSQSKRKKMDNVARICALFVEELHNTG